jgi:MoxR-like ATPase
MHDDVSLGGSPRASIALFRTAQAYAAINGRNFVLPDDVKKMVQPVLAHRMILRPESRLRKLTPAAILNEIVSDVRVPAPAHGDEGEDSFGDAR